MAKTQHKPPINKDDIKKLYESRLFALNNPDALQNKVFFEVMLYFCRRGRQNLRDLKNTDLLVGIDPSKTKYVSKVKDELIKNRGSGNTNYVGPLRPVLSFEKYVSHLNPNNDFFYQRPKRIVNKSDGVWYGDGRGPTYAW